MFGVYCGTQEEEAARLAEEAEAAKAADAERRKAERLARRAEAKRQGLILTGKAKREAERLAAMREQILKNAKLDEAGAIFHLILMKICSLLSPGMRRCIPALSLCHKSNGQEWFCTSCRRARGKARKEKGGVWKEEARKKAGQQRGQDSGGGGAGSCCCQG